MPLFRCQNEYCSTDPYGRLIFDFEADEPICPKCGTDGRKPGNGYVVIPLETIHFDPPSQIAGRGLGYLACQPGVPVSGKRATGEPSVVNCKECKKTELFLQANRPATVRSEYDFVITGSSNK